MSFDSSPVLTSKHCNFLLTAIKNGLLIICSKFSALHILAPTTLQLTQPLTWFQRGGGLRERAAVYKCCNKTGSQEGLCQGCCSSPHIRDAAAPHTPSSNHCFPPKMEREESHTAVLLSIRLKLNRFLFAFLNNNFWQSHICMCLSPSFSVCIWGPLSLGSCFLLAVLSLFLPPMASRLFSVTLNWSSYKYEIHLILFYFVYSSQVTKD